MLAYDLWAKPRAGLIIQIPDKVGLVKVALKRKRWLYESHLFKPQTNLHLTINNYIFQFNQSHSSVNGSFIHFRK